MRAIEHLISELEEALPVGTANVDAEVAIAITDVVLELPVEARIVGASLQTSLPRGRLATGFAMPHGRLRLTFERGES